MSFDPRGLSSHIRYRNKVGGNIKMNQYKRLWLALAVVIAASFTVLGLFGYRAIHNAPPIPREVVTTDGRVLFDAETIQNGQNVWQSIGGQEVGSIFGHGAYVAPDWTADWLHREAAFTLDSWARSEGAQGYEYVDLGASGRYCSSSASSSGSAWCGARSPAD